MGRMWILSVDEQMIEPSAKYRIIIVLLTVTTNPTVTQPNGSQSIH
jgi:hypothetical protein